MPHPLSVQVNRTSNAAAASARTIRPTSPASIAKRMGARLAADQQVIAVLPTPNRLRITLRISVNEHAGTYAWAAHVHQPDNTMALWSGTQQFDGTATDAAVRYRTAVLHLLSHLRQRVGTHYGPSQTFDLFSSQPRLAETARTSLPESFTVESRDPHFSVLKALESVIEAILAGPVARRAEARELARTRNDRTRILAYTDGSVGYGRSSCAFVADTGDFDGSMISQGITGNSGNPTVAELYGVVMAIHRFAEFEGHLHIKCDSKPAITLARAAMQGKTTTHSKWLRMAQEAIIAATQKSAARSLTIDWVRGHNGDPLNEIADEIAVMARRHGQAGIEYTQSRDRIQIAVKDRLEQFHALAA